MTVKAALAAYRVDLLARSADLKNADRPRRHLGTLLQKPCVLLTKDELTTWRNGLVSKGRLTPSSINRVMSTLRAALTLACPERTQIWRDGLTALPNAEKSRNALFVLPDATIIALVAKAYAKDAKLGLLCDVLAETGMRPSQAARARVGYLIMHASAPRLLVNKSAKGGGKLRAQKKLETYALPISVGLAAKLKQAVRGRAEDDKLLVNADGQPLNEADVHTDYRAPFTEIVQALGLDPKITPYCFRHSSITRQLLKGVPVRVVASNHDTSVRMIEATYSKFIGDHADHLTRAALLDHAMPAVDNLVALVR